MPTAIELSEQYRKELLANDAKALARLVRAYKSVLDNLQDKLELLMKDLGNGHHTISQVHRAERYKSLMAQVLDQLRDLQGLTRAEMDTAAKFGINLGINHSRGLIAAVAGDERLAIVFNKLNPEVVKSLLGFLNPDGALYKRLGKLSKIGADRIAQDLVNGIVAGYNPTKIAAIFRRAWGMTLTDAMRMTRTVQLYSYREATRANYIANGAIVEGWIWSADLSPDTCAECIAMHGTFHTNEETLNDHHNGRCAMIPVVKGFPPVIEGTGEEWFKGQSEQTQRNMLGDSKYDAWKGGKFEFGDLTGTRDDPVYGEMRYERSLVDILGEG